MKANPYMLRRVCLALLLIMLFTSAINAQAPFWSNGGNNSSSGDFLGTTNNQPLIFKSNGVERMRILANGNVSINAFQSLGNGLVWSNAGVLSMTAFTNDTNQVFTGAGNFKSIATLSGWTRTGNVLYNSPGVNVGIGTSSPAYLLHVNGDAYFNGTVYAQGVILTNKLLADTLKATSMFSLNNNLHMSAGGLNQIYTSNGDLRFQSNAGNSYNTIFHAGTSGNVGIGTFNPAYKLDVVGPVRFVNDVYVSRLRPLPGDSVVIIGDSSIVFGNANRIFPTTNVAVRGISIGNSNSTANGLYSLAFGSKVKTNPNAAFAIVIGSGPTASPLPLENIIPNSLMIGFNSDKPTFFMAPASGVGTLGRIGIGTTSPDALFQIEGGVNRIVMDQCGANNQGFISYIGFNASRDPNSGLYKFLGDGGQNNSGSLIMQDNDGTLRFYVAARVNGVDQQKNPAIIKTQSILTLSSERVQIGDRTIMSTSTYNTAYTKLTVDGRVMCQDLVVSIDADWPDYVFDSTYVLMPIDSLDTYVHTQMHLPESAPADSVATNGVSLGELCTQQQKQIEELTLYIIQLNARLNTLEKKEKEEARKEENQPAEGGQK